MLRPGRRSTSPAVAVAAPATSPRDARPTLDRGRPCCSPTEALGARPPRRRWPGRRAPGRSPTPGDAAGRPRARRRRCRARDAPADPRRGRGARARPATDAPLVVVLPAGWDPGARWRAAVLRRPRRALARPGRRSPTRRRRGSPAYADRTCATPTASASARAHAPNVSAAPELIDRRRDRWQDAAHRQRRGRRPGPRRGPAGARRSGAAAHAGAAPRALAGPPRRVDERLDAGEHRGPAVRHPVQRVGHLRGHARQRPRPGGDRRARRRTDAGRRRSSAPDAGRGSAPDERARCGSTPRHRHRACTRCTLSRSTDADGRPLGRADCRSAAQQQGRRLIWIVMGGGAAALFVRHRASGSSAGSGRAADAGRRRSGRPAASRMSEPGTGAAASRASSAPAR